MEDEGVKPWLDTSGFYDPKNNEAVFKEIKEIGRVKNIELRIGNLISDGDGDVRTVAYVTKDTIGLENSVGGTDKYQHNPLISGNIEDLKPIPLSEDWLKRMGFENDTYSNFRKDLNDEFKEQYLTVSFSDYVCKDYNSTGFSDFDLIADCEYVHSLQNLYYALTGEELEVK